MTTAVRIPHSRPTSVPGEGERAAAIIASGQHAGGQERRAFEQEFARRLGVKHAFAVQSGSAALHLALLSLGARPGSNVLLPSYVCVAVLNAVTACGARPVLYDVDSALFNPREQDLIDALARARLEPRDVTAAVVPHTFGFPTDFASWSLSLPIVEDCAMALGARLRKEEVGVWGRVATFSFYATKMMSTGFGGMVVTSDSGLVPVIEDLLRYDGREDWSQTTWNYRLSDIQAALGRSQLDHVDRFLERRQSIAAFYRDTGRRLGLPYHASAPEAVPNYFRFTYLLDDRRQWEIDLAAAGIESKPPVFRPLHHYLKLDPEAFRGTDAIYDRALSVPIYPSLTDPERDFILETLAEIQR